MGTPAKEAKLSYDTKNGVYRVACGKKLNVKGILTTERFPLGGDRTQALIRKAIILEHWKKIQLEGREYWTDEDYRELERQRIITPRKTNRAKLDACTALKLHKEPMSKNELAPFLDDKGNIKPEEAVTAVEYLARKFLGASGVRGQLLQEWENAVFAGRGTELLLKLKELFGWNGPTAQQFLFNIQNGSNGVGQPIAFDASSALAEIIDVTGDKGDASLREDTHSPLKGENAGEVSTNSDPGCAKDEAQS